MIPNATFQTAQQISPNTQTVSEKSVRKHACELNVQLVYFTSREDQRLFSKVSKLDLKFKSYI